MAFWACRGTEVVTATRNRGRILDIGGPGLLSAAHQLKANGPGKCSVPLEPRGPVRRSEPLRSRPLVLRLRPRSLGNSSSPQGVVPSLPVQLVSNRTGRELAADRGVAASSGRQACRPRSPRGHARGGDDEPALAQPSNCQASCDWARANISRSRPSTNQVSRLQNWPRSAPYCCWG